MDRDPIPRSSTPMLQHSTAPVSQRQIMSACPHGKKSWQKSLDRAQCIVYNLYTIWRPASPARRRDDPAHDLTGNPLAARSSTTRRAAVSRKDAAYETIREAIVENRLEPGTPLSEEKLAARHGLSRTPIREVLQRLSRDGLVETIRNRGAFVSRLDPRDHRDLFEMRQALEGLAARLAAQRMDADELARLDALYRPLRGRRRAAGREALSRAGHELHTAIGVASGNRRLIQALDAIQLQSRRAFRFSMGIPDRMERSFREHLPILAALKRRDPDAAEAAMRAHLHSAWTSLVAELANPRPGRPPSIRRTVTQVV